MARGELLGAFVRPEEGDEVHAQGEVRGEEGVVEGAHFSVAGEAEGLQVGEGEVLDDLGPEVAVDGGGGDEGGLCSGGRLVFGQDGGLAFDGGGLLGGVHGCLFVRSVCGWLFGGRVHGWLGNGY